MATFIWQRRGRFPAAVLTIFAVFLFTQLRLSKPAQATSDGSAYAQPPVVDTNGALDIVETTITANETTVNIGGPGGGVMANVLTFNGTIPGPQFRLKVGDTVIVHYVNNLDHNSGIHWHGIELSNHSDGTPLTQNLVPPGGTFQYKFKVTRPGIYWYHPHHHSSTNQVFKGLYGTIIVTDPNEDALIAAGRIPTAAQTLSLALADVTVCKAVGNNDNATYNPALPHVSGGPLPGQQGPTPKKLCETEAIDEDGNARPAFLAGDVPNIQKGGNSGTVNEGQTVLTNGRNVGGRQGTPLSPGLLALTAETYPVQAGQGLRLQIGNTATTRFFRLRLTDNSGALVQLFKIGGESGLLNDAVRLGNVVGPPAPGDFIFGYEAGEVLVDPGDRIDVVAAIPAAATGVLTLWTEDYQRTGTGYANIPTVPVAHFSVSGSTAPFTIAAGTGLRSFTGNPVEVLGPANATLLDPNTFGEEGLSSQDITLTNVSSPVPPPDDAPPANNTLGINAFQGAHDFVGDYTTIPKARSARWAKLGDTLELSVTNMTAAHHPFHLHGFSIQPKDLTKAANPTLVYPPEFVDNIDVPPGYKLRFRVRLDDRFMDDGVTPGGGLGRWVLHCHIFFHATFGMIGEFDVVDHGNGLQKPHINLPLDMNPFVNPGDPVEIRGVYIDTNHQGITLTASLGTITDLGGGAWSWRHTAGRGQSGLVFLTITDAGRRSDQLAFRLTVNDGSNRPPVAVPDTKNTHIGTPIRIPVLNNDRDPDGDMLRITQVTQPRIGTATLNADSTITYTPPGMVAGVSGLGAAAVTPLPGPTGTASFGYTVEDGFGGMATTYVAVTVRENRAPIAVPDAATVPNSSSILIAVLANDSDPDGDMLAVTQLVQPRFGSAVLNPDGTILYTAPRDGSGVTSVGYTVSDGFGGSARTYVAVTVTPQHQE